ncbi:MAG: hypothetical protein ACO397_04385 [Gammaproteobacteria bacterium]|jgi:hypothetical protein
MKFLYPLKITIAFVVLFTFSACAISPFLEVNARDNFVITDGASFIVSTNKSDLPANIDPISVEIAGEEAARYLGVMGFVENADQYKYILELTVSTKDKLRMDDYRFRSYYGWGRPYDFDRVETVPEYFMRISLIEAKDSKTLWTGLTKWRGNRINGSLDSGEIKESVSYILDQL